AHHARPQRARRPARGRAARCPLLPPARPVCRLPGEGRRGACRPSRRRSPLARHDQTTPPHGV
ncbi:MAG: hypothetical protein AVDCRST_MAG06-2106, partial [uncultured Nocardioides sp.]